MADTATKPAAAPAAKTAEASAKPATTLTQKEFNTLQLSLNHYSKSLAVDGTDHLLAAGEVGALTSKLKALTVDEKAEAQKTADAQAAAYKANVEAQAAHESAEQAARKAAAARQAVISGGPAPGAPGAAEAVKGNPGVAGAPATMTDRAKETTA